MQQLENNNLCILKSIYSMLFYNNMHMERIWLIPNCAYRRYFLLFNNISKYFKSKYEDTKYSYLSKINKSALHNRQNKIKITDKNMNVYKIMELINLCF